MRESKSSVEDVAVMLQRAKTTMEVSGFSRLHWDAYWKLSQAIWSLEKSADISAPELRDLWVSRSE